MWVVPRAEETESSVPQAEKATFWMVAGVRPRISRIRCTAPPRLPRASVRIGDTYRHTSLVSHAFESLSFRHCMFLSVPFVLGPGEVMVHACQASWVTEPATACLQKSSWRTPCWGQDAWWCMHARLPR